MSDKIDSTNEVKDAVNAYKQLRTAIQSIPLEELKKDIEIHGRFYLRNSEDEIKPYAGFIGVKETIEGKHKDVPTAVKSRAQSCRKELNAQVDHLIRHGEIGDTDAIVTLIELGLEIAGTLEEWSKTLHQQDENATEDKPHNDKKLKIAQYEDDINWREDLDSAVDFISSCDTIQEDLKKALSDESHNRRECNYDFSTIIDPPSSSEAMALIHQHCSLLLQRRIEIERGKTIQNIAQIKNYWPVRVSAIINKRAANLSDYLELIQLGGRTGVRSNLKGLDPKKQSSRNLTLEIIQILNAERLSGIPNDLLAEYQQDENNSEGEIFEPGLKLPTYKTCPNIFEALMNQGHDEKKPALKPSLSIPTPDEFQALLKLNLAKKKPPIDWHIENIWRRKAALLPELAKEHTEQWLNAIMAYVASECRGKFEEYPWPENIVDRASKKSQTTEITAREVIARHLVTMIA